VSKDQTLNPRRQKLAGEFIVPPFTSLDARSGRWQARKKLWQEFLNLDKGAGRDVDTYGKWEKGDKSNMPARAFRNQTSEFDPVLAEVLTHWFSPPGGLVADPYAGGIVRGAVATCMGRRYYGCDLSNRQVEANYAAWRALEMLDTHEPRWRCMDSIDPPHPDVLGTPDLVLSCPPYGPLEKYSEDSRDLSNMDDMGFWNSLSLTVNRWMGRMGSGFGVFVVGRWRHRDGNLTQMSGELIRRVDFPLYAEMSMWTKAGSAPLRARQFRKSRKPVNTDQTVLVFIKGKPPEWHGAPTHTLELM